ncbi:MAG: UDP-N-acetylmuramate dehydrogenase [Pseudomonadota bacterium]
MTASNSASPPLLDGDALMARLPSVRGRMRPMAPLAPYTWLRVGGPAEVLFEPADTPDLAALLAGLSAEIPVTVLGVGSNMIIRDGGVPGVVVRLGRPFSKIISTDGVRICAGAATPDAKVASAAAEAGIAGLEFLRGVPGAMGGAVRMNAGAYGRYLADVFVSAEAVDRSGQTRLLTADQIGFGYRETAAAGLIYTAVTLEGADGDPAEIRARMDALLAQRSESQPVRDRTAGSTFRNPAGYSSTGAADDPMEMKAWALIEKAGCRGLRRGGAVMSEKHANFLTNAGGATAADLEGLGEDVRRRVWEATGVRLEWEIQRIGAPADPEGAAAAAGFDADAPASPA